MKKAVVVIPTYNEIGSIEIIVSKIFEVAKAVTNWEVHILVVDSNSNDGTQEKIESLMKRYPKLHLLKTKKEGLGKAYTQGFQYALEKINPYVIFEMDADLSHPPEKLPEFLHEIENGADFVIGSRYIKGGSIPADWGLHRKIFSIAANLVVKLGFMKLKISDWTGGFRAIKVWVIKEALSHIKNYSGYVFQIALLDFALKKNVHFKEVPFHFKDRTHGISKIYTTQYIIQIFHYVFTHSSFVKFIIVGFIGFGLDFGLSYLFIEKIKAAIWLATIVSTETAIINNFILNNFWSFSYKKIAGGKLSYFLKFIKFNFVSLGAILIQTVGISLAAGFFGKQNWYIYKVIIILFIVIPYSYILYNKFIWKER